MSFLLRLSLKKTKTITPFLPHRSLKNDLYKTDSSPVDTIPTELPPPLPITQKDEFLKRNIQGYTEAEIEHWMIQGYRINDKNELLLPESTADREKRFKKAKQTRGMTWFMRGFAVVFVGIIIGWNNQQEKKQKKALENRGWDSQMSQKTYPTIGNMQGDLKEMTVNSMLGDKKGLSEEENTLMRKMVELKSKSEN